MNGFEITVNIFSFLASIATLIACVPIFIAFVNYCKNIVTGNRLLVCTKFLSNLGAYPDDFEIYLQNKTNRIFYITRISLIINNKKVEILKEIDQKRKIELPPIKIEPYQITTIKGMCEIHSFCGNNTPAILVISIPGKNFYYDTLLLNKQQYQASYCKNYQRDSRNNKSDN